MNYEMVPNKENEYEYRGYLQTAQNSDQRLVK